MVGSGLRLVVGFVNPCPSWLGSWVGVFGLGLWCCPSFAGCLWCSWLGFGVGLLSGCVWFRARFPCPLPFPVLVCGWACVLGPGLGWAPPFLAGLSGCVFLRFFFLFRCWVSLSRALWSLPLSPFFQAGLLAFFFFLVCVYLFRCPFTRRAALPGLVLPVLAGWSPCACLGVLSSVASGWGVWPPSVLMAGGLVAVGCFRAAPPSPPPFFFFWWGGGGRPGFSPLCLPSMGACSVAGVWCGWSLATPGGGSCVLLPATPGWVSLPVVVGGPRHSWLGSVGGVPVWCVVCGGGVLVGLWLVCGVVGPSRLLAEVPVCYSPPLLAGFRCRWWWAVPATPGWGPLAALLCGVWCVAVVCWWGCGWCVVWLVPRHSWRWFLCATPRHSWLGFAAGGGGRSPPLLAGVRLRRSCVVCGVWCVVCGGGVLVGLWLVCGVVGPSLLLAEVPVCYSPPLLAGFRCRWWWAVPATPGWGPLAAVVCGVWRWCVVGVVVGVWCAWSLATPGGGPCVLLPATPGWVSLPLVVGGPRHSWLGSACGAGVWCVVCGGGVLVGLWLVCGVVGPSPLLAEVPVCYSPPLLAGFRCRWWWAVPATPGWGPLAAVVCGVWCVVCGGGVLLGLWLVCGVLGPSPLLAEVPVCYSPPLLAGFRCRWWWAVPATPGWGPLAAVVCGV